MLATGDRCLGGRPHRIGGFTRRSNKGSVNVDTYQWEHP